MDTRFQRLNDLKTLMELQRDGMQDFQETQLRVRQALLDRSWPDLDKALHSLEFKAEGLKCLEERRNSAWLALGECLGLEHPSFYRVLADLEQPWKEELAELHRALKLKALEMKGLSEGLNSYVQTAQSLIKAVVRQADPAQRGPIYAKNGSIKHSRPRPMVLDKRL